MARPSSEMRPREHHGYGKRGSPGYPTYRIWQLMIQRCHNSKNTGYCRYGNRGIAVCKEWRSSFLAFLRDMGPRPSPRHSIDRINNDGDYCKDNCQWATASQQSRNTRRTIRMPHDVPYQCALDATRALGSKRELVARRLRNGWDLRRAISTPVNRWRVDLQRIADLRASGQSYRAIASWLGISIASAHRVSKPGLLL